MRKWRYLTLLSALFAAFYLGACGNAPNSKPPRVRNPVNLRFEVYYDAAFKDQSLYVLVHDENGNPLQTHSINISKPSPQTLELTNVPGNGYITGVQVLTEQRRWPTEGEYKSLYVRTLAVPIAQRLEDFYFKFQHNTFGGYSTGRVSFGYSNRRIGYPRVSLSGSCPASAQQLAGFNFEPGMYWWSWAGCNNDVLADGSAVSSMAQTDGKITFIDWAMQSWDEPLKPYAYIYSEDHDPGTALVVTQGDYQNATKTWTLRITGVPSKYSDFEAYYYVLGVRKGATIAGFSTRNDDPCQDKDPGELCDYATTVDIPGLAESYIVRAGLKREKSNVQAYSLIWQPISSLESDFVLGYNQLLPPFTGWSISDDLSHLSLTGGAAGVSQYSSIEVWNTDGSRYANFSAFTLNPSTVRVDLLPLPNQITSMFNFTKSNYSGWISIWRYDTDYMPPFDVPPLDKQVRTLVIRGSWSTTQSLGISGPSFGDPGLAPTDMHH